MPKRFDEDLSRLKQGLLMMGALAEGMVRKTFSALADRRRELVREVLEVEDRLDAFQREIDAETVRLISVYTPVAEDLRVLLMITRINAELERIGDQAVTVCRTYQDLALLEQPPLKPLEDLSRMAAVAEDMLHKGLRAFLDGSVEESMAVIEADNEGDQLNDRIFHELLTFIVRDRSTTGPALGLILTARGFERIADHAVNIAEDVVYIVRGQDIRHTAK